MKAAIISPPHVLPAVASAGLSYHMFLGQEVARDHLYRRAMGALHNLGHFIMVDNGAAEPEEERASFNEIINAVEGVGYDEIVLPDVLYDSEATLKASLNRNILKRVPACKRIAIPQGHDWDEWEHCLWTFTHYVQFRTIGVPKHLEKLPGGRVHALKIIAKHFVEQVHDIHLFGVWRRPLEECLTPQRAGFVVRVRGIDSGAAVAYTQNKRVLCDEEHYSLDWYKEVDIDLLMRNVHKFVDAARR